MHNRAVAALDNSMWVGN